MEQNLYLVRTWERYKPTQSPIYRSYCVHSRDDFDVCEHARLVLTYPHIVKTEVCRVRPYKCGGSGELDDDGMMQPIFIREK